MGSIKDESPQASGISHHKDFVKLEESRQYVLGRGYLASTRLNIQHFLYREAQGYLLHPRIQEELIKTAGGGQLREITIADMATGTGVWMLDLNRSKEIKGLNAKLHGFDISPDNFPHTSWLPESVSFSLSNLLEDPPREFWETFDVVHVRLVATVTMFCDIRVIIRHILKLLKPGGLVQWEEIDYIRHYRTRVKDRSVDGANTETDRIYGMLRTLGDFNWVLELPKLLEEEGFVDANQDPCEPPPELYHVWTCQDLVAATELSYQPAMLADAAEQLRKTVDKSWEEVRNIGTYSMTVPLVTVARKRAA